MKNTSIKPADLGSLGNKNDRQKVIWLAGMEY